MLKFNQYLEEKKSVKEGACGLCGNEPCICECDTKTVKESAGDICPECLQDPCVCGGNHIIEEVQNHKVNVTVSDPNHQAVSQRKEKIAKRVIVKSHTKEGAVEKAKEFYKKKGYKVHDAEHHSIVPKSTMKTEEVQLEEDLRAQLQKHSDAAIVANKAGDDEKVKYHMNKVNAIKDKMAKQARNEEVNLSEGAYEKAEENKRSAESAKKQGDMFAHHLHMADHHDNMAEWHDSKGRHGEADRHAKKSEEHHAQAMKLKEEVEQIDELNKDTLSSYRMAAHRDVNKKVDQKSKGEISNKDYEHGIKKRSKGITKADNKLGTYKNSRIDISANADSIRKFGTNESVAEGLMAKVRELMAKHKK